MYLDANNGLCISDLTTHSFASSWNTVRLFSTNVNHGPVPLLLYLEFHLQWSTAASVLAQSTMSLRLHFASWLLHSTLASCSLQRASLLLHPWCPNEKSSVSPAAKLLIKLSDSTWDDLKRCMDKLKQTLFDLDIETGEISSSC